MSGWATPSMHFFIPLGAYTLLLAVRGANRGDRFGLPNVAAIWHGAVILTLIMYPIATVFVESKHREKHRKPWLSYF